MAAEDKQVQACIVLPDIVVSTEPSLSQLLQKRRSIREFQDLPLSMAEIGQLLWAAQGITHPQGLRTAPSAGALYPLELYVVVGSVEGLAAGVYHYEPKQHQLTLTDCGDKRKALAHAALGQSWISDAAIVVVFTAVYKRTTRKYGPRGERYVHIEAGHAAENLFLQAEEFGLGAVVVGAFDDLAVDRLLQLPADAQAVIMMPVGRSATKHQR